MASEPLRIAAFAVACLLLLGAALLLQGGHLRPQQVDRRPGPQTAILRLQPASTPGPLNPRPFLTAFLRYEVGETTPRVQAELRATASAAFSKQLLGTPVRTNAGSAARARITKLHITHLSSRPPRAEVAGTALRATGPEPFAFLFEAPAGRWLAAGPAE